MIELPDNCCPILDFDRAVYATAFAGEHKQLDGTTEVEPLPFVLQTMKQSIKKILTDLKVEDSDRGYWMYLTGSNNFRNKARIKPYKGNRKQAKPYWYNEVRQYLVDQWHAHVCENIEADDAVVMKAYEEGEGAIICSGDKDLLQAPGWHYNPVKEELRYVTEEEAYLSFWTQCLTGDSVDFIGGVPKIGKVKASKILEGARNEQDCYHRVRRAYHDAYGKTGCKTFDGDVLSPDEALDENAMLLHLLRFEGDTWKNRIN